MTSPVNKDYYRLASYATGAQINHNPFGVQELQSQLLFAGGTMALPIAFKAGKATLWTAPKWAYKNFGNYTSAWQELMAKNKASKDAINYLKGNNIFETINNRSNYNSLLELEKNLKSAPDYRTWSKLKTETARKKFINQGIKARYYDEARQLIEKKKKKKLTGKELKAHLKKVDEAIAKADLAVHKAVTSGEIKPATLRGKAWAGVKKYTGYDAVNGALKKGATSSNKVVRNLAKGAKGGGLATAAIGLAIETPEIIETYKKCGAGKGTKQLAKTTAVVAAEGVGYAVGAKVGAIAGAKVGATIGTCIGGPVGTAIGGAVGALIGVGTGILCSWAAGKGAKAMVGKSELEKQKEQEARKLAKDAIKSEEGKEKLLSKVEEKSKEEGGCTDDKVIAAYEKLTNDKEEMIAETETVTETKTTKKESDKSKYIKENNYSDILNKLNMLASGNYNNNIFTNPIYNNSYSQFTMPNMFGLNMFNTYNPYNINGFGMIA